MLIFDKYSDYAVAVTLADIDLLKALLLRGQGDSVQLSAIL